MRIEKKHPGIFNVTLSGYELATMISSVRWAVDGAKGDLNPESVSQLKHVLANYENAATRMQGNSPSRPYRILMGDKSVRERPNPKS